MRPVRGYRRGVVAGEAYLALVPLNPGAQGEYTEGAVRRYLPPPPPGGSCWGTEEGKMDTQWLSQHSVEVSGQIVLECSGCGEELFLFGLEEDWPKEHRNTFGCTCGETITLADRVDGTAYAIKALLRGSIKARSGVKRD
jgi:hypothetical protein